MFFTDLYLALSQNFKQSNLKEVQYLTRVFKQLDEISIQRIKNYIK